jgi:hypothetical protein
VSGEVNRVIAAAINADPKWFWHGPDARRSAILRLREGVPRPPWPTALRLGLSVAIRRNCHIVTFMSKGLGRIEREVLAALDEGRLDDTITLAAIAFNVPDDGYVSEAHHPPTSIKQGRITPSHSPGARCQSGSAYDVSLACRRS